jgi:hypothetical protein
MGGIFIYVEMCALYAWVGLILVGRWWCWGDIYYGKIYAVNKTMVWCCQKGKEREIIHDSKSIRKYTNRESLGED